MYKVKLANFTINLTRIPYYAGLQPILKEMASHKMLLADCLFYKQPPHPKVSEILCVVARLKEAITTRHGEIGADGIVGITVGVIPPTNTFIRSYTAVIKPLRHCGVGSALLKAKTQLLWMQGIETIVWVDRNDAIARKLAEKVYDFTGAVDRRTKRDGTVWHAMKFVARTSFVNNAELAEIHEGRERWANLGYACLET